MDKDNAFGSTKLLILTLLALVSPCSSLAKTTPKWTKSLRKRMREIEAAYPGQLGLYVKNLATGEELSFHGEETWYLASGVKVPIAIEVMRQLDLGTLTLDSTVKIKEDDFVDGAGQTNKQKPGSLVTVRFLLEQMLIHSDNTASDLLIRLVGLAQVNELVQRSVPVDGFTDITTLADVRRHAYGAFHPRAHTLANHDFILLKAIHDERKRVQKLSELLHVSPTELRFNRIDDAFSAYYGKRLNSAPLRAYGRLLESLVQGKLLSPSSTSYLLDVMSRAETGKHRLKAGLPKSVVFAHKTGTQHARICDFGVISSKIVVAACSRGIASQPRAEKAIASLGRALTESGALDGID